MSKSPYHEGELSVQALAGEEDTGQRNGGVIADTIIKGALRFITEQPFIVTGSTDKADRVWASILIGRPGFMAASERAIEIDLTQTLPNPSDPFWENIEGNSRIGTLFIELTRRRRLRVNGDVVRLDNGQLRLDVVESYPNCPKYIQRRNVSVDSVQCAALPASVLSTGTVLTRDQSSWIASADTLFAASAHPERGVDVSHRGGNPGFVQVLNERTLRVPDYAGNSMFNTLGNFAEYPQAGLLFIDFQGSRTLQLVGKPTILWDQDLPDHETGGTHRYWEFEIEQWLETDEHVAPTWEFVENSSFNP